MHTMSSTTCDFCCGWIAGMAGLVVGHPIDTLKVRQQILGQSIGRSIVNIYKSGGILKFFRGMGVPLLSTGAMNSVYFGFYGSALDILFEWRRQRAHKTDYNHDLHQRHSQEVYTYWDYFIAGCVGGAAQLVVACPVDLVKVQLQSQLHKGAVKGPVECVTRILRTNGIFGVYKGLTIQAFRDIPSSGLYFAIYESLKRKLTFAGVNGKSVESSKLTQFMAGGIAGILSWWSIIPLDVIKSRIQGETIANHATSGNHRYNNTMKYQGIIHCGMVIVKTHGIRGLFHGFWPLSLRAFPVNGTTFLVYELLFRNCKQYQTSL